MPYRPIKWSHISNASKKDVFRRANMYLADAYSMLSVKPAKGRLEGACNFSIVLVLLCIVDGISLDIYPRKQKTKNRKQETRFKRLIRDKLPWGPCDHGWIEKGQAAKWLYVEFRNPLTHELGKDISAKRRPVREYEPAIGKWGHLTEIRVDSLDAKKRWNNDWPVIRWATHEDGRRISLSAAALYWAVKRMVRDLARKS